ncbi:AsmA-like C-terminal region-containing protein, partial [bacterium]|nr:AsmA-like C-terminal region-containing protein [bacterium]
LLSEYSFFKGLAGGKLLYSAIIDGDNYTSKLKIENFKVINAPGMVKLLSLADLGGLADLAEGEGLSFDVLEINMEKNNNTLLLNEILALGPSVSVLMEGYQDSSVTSLRGTLVPGKTLNKIISKIPLIGNIVIPKDVGEGLFGISFKMKGPPGKIKTSINPIRTITPRFIQKIIDKNKSLK